MTEHTRHDFDKLIGSLVIGAVLVVVYLVSESTACSKPKTAAEREEQRVTDIAVDAGLRAP